MRAPPRPERGIKLVLLEREINCLGLFRGFSMFFGRFSLVSSIALPSMRFSVLGLNLCRPACFRPRPLHSFRIRPLNERGWERPESECAKKDHLRKLVSPARPPCSFSASRSSGRLCELTSFGTDGVLTPHANPQLGQEMARLFFLRRCWTVISPRIWGISAILGLNRSRSGVPIPRATADQMISNTERN